MGQLILEIIVRKKIKISENSDKTIYKYIYIISLKIQEIYFTI